MHRLQSPLFLLSPDSLSHKHKHTSARILFALFVITVFQMHTRMLSRRLAHKYWLNEWTNEGMSQMNWRSHMLTYSRWHRVKDWGEQNISAWQWSVSAEFNSLSSKIYLVLAYWPASTPQHLPWNRAAKFTNPPSHHLQVHSSFPSSLTSFLFHTHTHTHTHRSQDVSLSVS